jgi:hypothetical protein
MLKLLSKYQNIHFLLVALQQALQELGIPSVIVNEDHFTEDLYVVTTIPCYYCNFPENYIVYNLEQLPAHDSIHGDLSVWSPGLVDRLRKAKQIWDYSPLNISLLREKYGLHAYYVPVGYSPILEAYKPLWLHRTYDITLIGAWKPFQRRLDFTEELFREYESKPEKILYQDSHCTTYLGNDLINIYCQSKSLVNVHVYEYGNILEVVRLLLCVIFKVYIFTEPSFDTILDEEWKPFVEYITKDSFMERFHEMLQLSPEQLQTIVEERYQLFVKNNTYVHSFLKSGLDLEALKNICSH